MESFFLFSFYYAPFFTIIFAEFGNDRNFPPPALQFSIFFGRGLLIKFVLPLVVCMPEEISHIVLLVHPFFRYRGIDQRIQTDRERENIRFLSKLWGKQIQQAARNPRAIVVIVLPKLSKRGNPDAKPLIKTLVQSARKALGQRLFVTGETMGPRALQNLFRRRGLVLNRSAFQVNSGGEPAGKSFGEDWGECPQTMSRTLEDTLQLPAGSIHPMAHLSIRPWSSIGLEPASTLIRFGVLGGYKDNLRVNSRRLRDARHGKK